MASENTRTPTSVARENTYYFRSGRPLPQYLNQEYTEKLKVLENGNVVPKDDNDTAVREWLAPLDKICLYQFLIHGNNASPYILSTATVQLTCA